MCLLFLPSLRESTLRLGKNYRIMEAGKFYIGTKDGGKRDEKEI